jgi:hypothetical protein
MLSLSSQLLSSPLWLAALVTTIGLISFLRPGFGLALLPLRHWRELMP